VTEEIKILSNNTKIPENWFVVKLEDVVDILDRKRIPVNAKERAKRTGNIPYYGATGQVGWIDDYLFDEELILLGEDGAPFFDLSKQKAFIIHGKSWVNNHAHVLRALNGLPNNYIKYYLDVFDYHGYVSGTTRLKLNQTSMRKIPVLLAPLNEQKRIVAEIEKQFSRLDEAVANLTRIKANLKRYKASVLKAAVEGKLTEEWRKINPDVEPADKLLERILVERRKKWEEAELAKMKAKGKEPKNDKWKKKYKEPLLPATKGLANFPGSWTFVGVEQILPARKDAMKTGPFGSLLKKHEHRQKGVRVLGIENIQAMKFIFGSKIHIDSDKAKELVGYRTIPGDVIISRSGTVGEVCVVPENIGEARISTNLMKLSFKKNGMLPQFFTFIFNGAPFVLNQVSELCKGSTRNFLNQNILKKLVLILPPVEEQRLIIQKVENKLSIIDEIDKEVDKNLKRADCLRQSILNKAFSGKLI